MPRPAAPPPHSPPGVSSSSRVAPSSDISSSPSASAFLVPHQSVLLCALLLLILGRPPPLSPKLLPLQPSSHPGHGPQAEREGGALVCAGRGWLDTEDPWWPGTPVSEWDMALSDHVMKICLQAMAHGHTSMLSHQSLSQGEGLMVSLLLESYSHHGGGSPRRPWQGPGYLSHGHSWPL